MVKEKDRITKWQGHPVATLRGFRFDDATNSCGMAYHPEMARLAEYPTKSESHSVGYLQLLREERISGLLDKEETT